MKKVLTTTIISVSFLYGVNIPTTGDILQQTKKPEIEEPKKVLPQIVEKYKEPLIMDDNFKFIVKKFIFTGNANISTNKLEIITNEFLNSEVGFNSLQQIVSKITKYYRNNGYFVARAYLPEQKIKDGIVEISIIEGTYGKFLLENQSLVNDTTLEEYFKPLSQNQTISISSLEKQLMLINDLSGIIVSNAISYPGEKVGEGNFRISTLATNKTNSYISLNNYGSKYTGEYKLSIGTNINSITGTGDTLSLNGIVTNTANLKNIGINYKRPLGYSGLFLSLNSSYTEYNLDKITNYEGFGTTKIIGAALSYPIIKTNSHTQEIGLNLSHKNMDDSSGLPGSTTEAQKSINSLTLNFNDNQNFKVANLPANLFSSFSLTSGHTSMDNSVAVTNDSSIQTQGDFYKANINFEYQQRLTTMTSLNFSLNAQKSFGKNLDSSEDISVSGSNGVRAYEDAELSGDEGFILSLNLNYDLPNYKSLTQQISLFMDAAKVWQNSNLWSGISQTGYMQDNKRELYDIGFAYGFVFQNLNFNITFAHGFGEESLPTSESEFSTNRTKVLTQILARF